MLAGPARLTVYNCKANLQSLAAKPALEEYAGFSHTRGRSYLIYNEAELLRRRTEGWTYSVKIRGVRFVDPWDGFKKVHPMGSARQRAR